MSIFKLTQLIVMVSLVIITYLFLRGIYLRSTRVEKHKERKAHREELIRDHNLVTKISKDKVLGEHKVEMKIQRGELSNAGKVARSEDLKNRANDFVTSGRLTEVVKDTVDYSLNNFVSSSGTDKGLK